MQKHGIAILCGGAIGLALFAFFFDIPAHADEYEYATLAKYTGVVLNVDTPQKTIIVAVPSEYPYLMGSVPTHFTYDASTQWASFEFRFQGEVAVERAARAEEPRELTPGTRVYILTSSDPEQALLATSVVFLRRTDI